MAEGMSPAPCEPWEPKGPSQGWEPHAAGGTLGDGVEGSGVSRLGAWGELASKGTRGDTGQVPHLPSVSARERSWHHNGLPAASGGAGTHPWSWEPPSIKGEGKLSSVLPLAASLTSTDPSGGQTGPS